MSIIYNALQKTQQHLGSKQNSSSEERSLKAHWIDICLISIIVCLLVIITFAYYPKIKMKPIAPPVTAKSPPIIKKSTADIMPVVSKSKTSSALPSRQYEGNLVLNGVFLSDQEKIALINNQPHHIGDILEGKKIVSIKLDSVTLQDEANSFVLRSAS